MDGGYLGPHGRLLACSPWRVSSSCGGGGGGFTIGEGNGRTAAADGIYRWGGVRNPSRSDQVASRTLWAWALRPYVGHWSWRPPSPPQYFFLWPIWPFILEKLGSPLWTRLFEVDTMVSQACNSKSNSNSLLKVLGILGFLPKS